MFTNILVYNILISGGLVFYIGALSIMHADIFLGNSYHTIINILPFIIKIWTVNQRLEHLAKLLPNILSSILKEHGVKAWEIAHW